MKFTQTSDVALSFLSFLKDDPIWVHVVKTSLRKQNWRSHTPKINVVRDVPCAHSQTMTVEPYNPLLMSHVARWDDLLCAFNKVKYRSRKPGKWLCTRLRNDISLAFWERPYLGRWRLDLFISNLTSSPRSRCGPESSSSCRLSAGVIAEYYTRILDEMGKIG